MDKVENLLTSIITAIVANPDDVKTHSEVGEDADGEITTIHVKVNQADVGLILGKQGATTEAIRRIVSLAGHRLADKRVYTKIDAPPNTTRRNHFYPAA